MSTTISLPRLEMSMTEGILAEWLVPDGAEVKEGQPIYAIETDKSTMEIEAPVSGKLIQKAAAGETYECGTELGEIV